MKNHFFFNDSKANSNSDKMKKITFLIFLEKYFTNNTYERKFLL